MADPTKFLESCLWALIDANDDAALTELCRKIVPRVLVGLRSDAARGKALEVVKTLSSRVKSATAVALPLAEIYAVFANAEASPYEKNIALMFLELGWKRATAAEQAALVLRILPNVAAHAEQYQLTLLQMALSALEHVGTLTNTAWSSVTLEGASAKVVRTFLLDVLLFAPPGAGQARVQAPAPSATSSSGSGAAAAPPAQAAPAPPPPGMAAAGLERVQTKTQHGEGKGVPEYLLTRKTAVLKALTGKMLSDEHAFPLAVVASCGAHHEVRRMGEDLLRTLTQANRVDLDADSAADTIETLFVLLLGSAEKIKQDLQAAGGKAPAYMGGKSPTVFVASAVDVPTRVVLLAQLCRSVRAANTFPFALQAIFQGIYGADASMRLKQAAMQFAVWTTSNARAEVLKPMAPIILSGLLKFIKEGDGATIANPQMVPLRGFTYSALGQLARRAPDLFRADVSIARQLFGALAVEQPEVKVSVQEALSMSCLAYRGVSGADKEQLMSLLLDAMQNKDAHQARFCSVYWANRLFPFSDVRARYVCLLAVADPKIEVKEEAERGLLLPSERITSPSAAAQPTSLLHAKEAEIKAALASEEYPPFEKIVEYLSSSDMLAARREQSAGVKAATVAFCNRCLTKSCEREGGITKRQYLVADAPPAGGGGDNSRAPREVAAEQMNILIEDALVTALGGAKGVADADLARQCLVALTDLQMARSDVVRRKYGGRLPWLENFLFSSNSDTRELAACIYGELAAGMDTSAAIDVVEGLRQLLGVGENGKEASLEKRQGSMLAMGYILSHAVDPATNAHKLPKEIVSSVLLALTLALSERRTEVVSSAARAIGLAGLHCTLMLPPGKMPPPAGAMASGGSADGEAATAKEEEEEVEELTVVRIIRALGVVVNKKGDGKDLSSDAVWKESEDAAHAVGMVAVSNRSESVLEACKAVLFATAGLKRTEEFHLCVGEALACCAGGRVLTSPQLLSQLRLPAAYQDTGSDAERAAAAWAAAGTPDAGGTVMVQLLDHVMNEVLTDGKPLVRAAGAPWLLCLLRYNSESPEVQSRISEFQQHFAYLLQERNEYLQEVASKGLGLCYDMCNDDAVKDELVATLAKALMSGTAMAQPKRRKTDHDEQLFDEGEVKIDDKALGEGSLTTYKELCTVATELGQPELIYRFLNLAGHQKVWNSRRGAAFGFSLIANKAADRLKPHLATLIPKLYRYQYDPNQSIQEAMGNLWQTVVPDPDKAKDEYLPHIFKELIPGVGSRLWRVREASCLGLADLLSGKRFAQVEEHLVEVYRMSLRAIDDVKETVRKAGQTLNRAVSGLCAKLADPSQSDAASSEKVLGLVLPLLLEEGIGQAAAEVRVASVQQLVKITKHAGAKLAPHIPEMASVLLESLSSLEPQMNTYLQLNADKYHVSGEALERARVSASRNSPLAETLDLCVRHMTEEAADALMPRLTAVVRQGVGLPTRCGCARFIGQLAVTPGPVGQVVRKHSSKLLKCLGAATASDRSAVVRQAMAGAAARVVAVAKESAVDEYIRDLTSTYFNHGTEDVSLRVMVGNACKDLLAMAADAIRDFLPQLLPLVFVAREDEEKDAAEAFQTVWEEGAGSTSAGLRLYSKEISEAIRSHLASPSWVVRKMAAKAAFACVDAGEGAGAADAARANRAVSLLPALRQSVANPRMWDGKECVLKALASSVVAANESSLDLARWRSACAPDTAAAHAHAADNSMQDVTGPGAAHVMGTTAMLEADGTLSRMALVQLVVAECSKKRSTYRKAALLALKAMLEKLTHVDVAIHVFAVVQEAVAEKKEEIQAPGTVPSAGRDADEEARYDALMESKGQQELRARALEALAAAWPAARSSRLALASDVLLLLEPFFKSPSMEERLAATSVASSFCARMSADLLGEGEAEGSMEEVLADVRKEWEVVAKTLFHGLYLGMNDLGPTRRAVRKAALTACEDWFALAAKLELAVGAEVGPGLCAQIAAVLRELIADQTDVKMRETAQGLLKKLELDSSGMAS